MPSQLNANNGASEEKSIQRSQLELVNVKLLPVSKYYLNYSFQSGKLYLITGQNGAGKSTLLHGLAGMTVAAEGSICVGGLQLCHRNWRGRNVWNKTALQSIHYVPQHVEDMWLGGTIRQELTLLVKQYGAMEQALLNRLESALTDFGFDPSTYERELISLSLGEQKRVALAIAFCLQGDWLLLDEPLAALDEVAKQLVVKKLQTRKQEGKGTIIVSHQLTELMPIIDQHLRIGSDGLQEADKESDLEEALFLRLLADLEEAEEARLRIQASSQHEQAVQASSQHEQAVHDHHGRDQQISPLPSLFDPRALMISMMICTASLIFWNSWLGIGLYAVLGIIITVVLHREVSRWSGIVIGFSLMTFILVVVGGLTYSPLGFEWSSAFTIAQRMLSLLVIIVLGLPLLSLMTPFRLQRALQQSVAPLRKVVPALDSYALLISLIFRFVPLLTGRWQTLQALCRSRFKITSSLSWSMLPALMLAYVRSILKLADQLATSLELRGFDRINSGPLLYAKVIWRQQDSLLIIVMLALMLLNAAIHQWF